ncbi:MAG: hypothetical protein RL632_759 [Bacteroidota bacterium]
MLLNLNSWSCIGPNRNFSPLMFKMITVFMLLASNIFAQENASEEAPLECVISFNESLNLPFLNNAHFQNVSWTIAGIDAVNFSVEGNGAALKDITFALPGSYIIGMKELAAVNDGHSDGCNHPHFPQEIHLTVLPYRVTFNFDAVTFSNPIYGIKELQGTLMTVPVHLESYNNKPADVSAFHVVSAGVGTTITGTLSNGSAELAPGDYLFSYALKGVAQKDSYIMFDFYTNGQTQSYYYPTKIN